MSQPVNNCGESSRAASPGRYVLRLAICLFMLVSPPACLGLLGPQAALGQQLAFTDPPKLVSSAQQLLIEQAAQLAEADEMSEALVGLRQLFDQADGELVRVESEQRAGTLTTRRFVNLRRWIGGETARLLEIHAEQRPKYEEDIAAQAARGLELERREKDAVTAQMNADRFFAADLGPQLNLLLADIYLEHGWTLAAMQALERAAPSIQFDLAAIQPLQIDEQNRKGRYQPTGKLPWYRVWSQSHSSPRTQELLDAWANHAAQQIVAPDDTLIPVLQRMLLAAEMEPSVLDAGAIQSWITAVSTRLPEAAGQPLQQLLEGQQAIAPTPGLGQAETFAENAGRSPRNASILSVDTSWPKWSQRVVWLRSYNDGNPASKPRAGEHERGTLVHHPVVHGDKIFVNELTRIVAFDLATGKPWPDITPALPLYDSGKTPEAHLPLGYPFVGMPRGTLTIENDALYARMGSPVTGSAEGEMAPDGGSKSFLIGMDLKKQGSLLRGFPLRLMPPEFSGAEFEGSPLIWGDLLMVALVNRDNVGLRRSIAAFDRFSGELRWRSPPLADGVVEGTRNANILSNQLLTLAGGRLFYNTNLGAIVCLDPQSGQIQWLTQYSRPDRQRSAYPTPDRYLYRDLTPCMVAGGLVYCAPQDCPEIFALEATTGDLVWSTDDVQVADAIHLLGVHDDCLVVSGDRLIWLDRLRGRLLGRFPGSTTPGLVNALPNPRGLGRGVLAGGEIYFPTADEILVFPAKLDLDPELGPFREPRMLQRWPLDSHGRDGGNLFAVGNILLVATPNRLVAYD